MHSADIWILNLSKMHKHPRSNNWYVKMRLAIFFFFFIIHVKHTNLIVHGLNKIGVFKCVKKCIPNNPCINLFCCRNETVINSHDATSPPSAPVATSNVYTPTDSYHFEEREGSDVIFEPRRVQFHKSLLRKT